MEMMNRAIEAASDFREFARKLSDGGRGEEPRHFYAIEAYRPGENREQRRARQRAERKAASRAKVSQ